MTKSRSWGLSAWLAVVGTGAIAASIGVWIVLLEFQKGHLFMATVYALVALYVFARVVHMAVTGRKDRPRGRLEQTFRRQLKVCGWELTIGIRKRGSEETNDGRT